MISYHILRKQNGDLSQIVKKFQFFMKILSKSAIFINFLFSPVDAAYIATVRKRDS